MKSIGLLLIITIAVSCNFDSKPKNFDYGKVENGQYTNSYFGMTIDLPDTWVVQNEEEKAAMMEMGKDLVAGEDQNLKAIIEASEVNTANLLTMFKYEVGSPKGYNPNFLVIAENLKNSPGVKTAKDYLFHARKLMERSNIDYDFGDGKIEKVIINDQEFYVMRPTIYYMGIEIHQAYYCTLVNGFSLGFSMSYMEEENRLIQEKIMNTVKFDN